MSDAAKRLAFLAVVVPWRSRSLAEESFPCASRVVPHSPKTWQWGARAAAIWTDPYELGSAFFTELRSLRIFKAAARTPQAASLLLRVLEGKENISFQDSGRIPLRCVHCLLPAIDQPYPDKWEEENLLFLGRLRRISGKVKK